MLEKIYSKTLDYINMIPKQDRKKHGQFFTEINIAKFMIKLFQESIKKETISILDPGAGTGILSCALIEELENNKNIKNIKLTCYEKDKNIINILSENLEEVKKIVVKIWKLILLMIIIFCPNLFLCKIVVIILISMI